MPAIQTTYSENISAGKLGAIVNTEHCNLISRNVETSAGLAFGLPVAQGANTDGVRVSGASAFDYIGFTVRDMSIDAATDIFKQYDSARIMTHGVLWVTVTDAGGVVQGDPVWVTKATGALSNADVGSSGGVNLAGCKWESAAANGGLAKIRINMDVPQVAGA
jgi:hypothetical protein